MRSNAPTAKEPQAAAPRSIAIQEQSIAGSIWDDAGEPLSSVQVSVMLGDKVLASGNTEPIDRVKGRVRRLVREELEI